MVGGSEAGCTIPLRGRQQLCLGLPPLLLPSSLCSHETGVWIGCLVGGSGIVGILPREELSSSFLPSLLCIRAMGGSQGLSDHSYRIAMGYFTPSNLPKGLWLLNRIKEVKRVAIGTCMIGIEVVRFEAGQRMRHVLRRRFNFRLGVPVFENLSERSSPVSPS